MMLRHAPIKTDQTPDKESLRARGSLTAMLHSRTQCVCKALLPALLLPVTFAQAAEHITLRNGYDLTCDHRETTGDKTRLFLDASTSSYVDVPTTEIATAEPATIPPPIQEHPTKWASPAQGVSNEVLTPGELHEVLQNAGTTHDLNEDLLASVVHAESNNHVHARSRAGAQGLMQLMPGTAAQLGVRDAFAPLENVGGGAAYLDAMLRRYGNNLASALAAYNAGPAAVDRYHGIPPYRETRLYVARIIREFNQRYAAHLSAVRASATANRPEPTTLASTEKP